MQPDAPHSHQLPYIVCPARAAVANGAEFVSLSPPEVEKNIGSTSVQTAANSNLIFTDLSSFKWLAELETRASQGALYQGIALTFVRRLRTDQALSHLVSRVATVADQAYDFRRLDIVGKAAQVVLSLPQSRELEGVGHYYEALNLNQRGRGRIARAASMFEEVADNAPAKYRARAMLALGSDSLVTCDYKTAMSLYREVMRAATRNHVLDPATLYFTSRMIAVIKSIDGDHRGALADLERMLPLARMASRSQPYAYYDYLNALAVELTEAGRLEEARNASGIALASPFASAYPEWRETREEIDLRGWRASRSRVAFNKRTSNKSSSEAENLVRMCVPERGDSASCKESIAANTERRAQVLDLLEWKKKMGKEPNDTSHHKKSYKDMDGREMLLKIMELTGARDRTDDELLEILEAIERILSTRKAPGK